MFRKPKRKAAKASLRSSKDEEAVAAAAASRGSDGDDDDDDETGELLSEARKRSKLLSSAAGGPSSRGGGTASSSAAAAAAAGKKKGDDQVMHSYGAAGDGKPSEADLATRGSEHHPERLQRQTGLVGRNKDGGEGGDEGNDEEGGKADRGADGIFRNSQRNKFLAGPIKATTNVRVTARFDYQPDICKDYKDTGFCGFGDTCIYLHDRGDTMTGWQLEQQWEEQQKQKKAKQEREMQDFVSQHTSGAGGGKAGAGATAITADDGLPFACYLCREYFKDPVTTNCGHFFCEKCIMNRVRTVDEACPICGKDTSSVFNQPTKLLSKKRQVVGSKASWEEYANAFAEGTQK